MRQAPNLVTELFCDSGNLTCELAVQPTYVKLISITWSTPSPRLNPRLDVCGFLTIRSFYVCPIDGILLGPYNNLQFPISDTNPAGFRIVQIAAIHAVSAHFFNSKQPAIVTMPTGSGKTTVLMALAFVLRAQRVLVLTPVG